MFPKLMCFFFGHKMTTDFFNGKTAVLTDVLMGENVIRPVYVRKEQPFCQRCRTPNLKFQAEQSIKAKLVEARQALFCLGLAVPPAVQADVAKRVEAAFSAYDAALATR